MKKYVILVILITGGLFASPLDLVESRFNRKRSDLIQEQTNENVKQSANFNTRFIIYTKLGPDVINIQNPSYVAPNFGMGIRSETFKDAVDLSFSYSSTQIIGEEKTHEIGLGEEEVTYREQYIIFQGFFPKVLYHKFISPSSSSSLFYGGGASWGFLANTAKDINFLGLFGNLSAGYEAGRDSSIRQIIQIDLDQPLLAWRHGSALPMPSIQASYALGF